MKAGRGSAGASGRFNRLVAIGLTAALATVVGACRKEVTPDAGSQEKRNVAERLLASLRANATRACPRPVLEGTPAAGPADADLLKLAEGRGALRPCVDAVAKGGAQLNKLLYLRPPVRGWPLRPIAYGRPPPRGKRPRPAADSALRDRCAILPVLVRRAIQHRDACSPYLPGRRAMGPLTPVIHVARAMAMLAWEVAGRSPLAGIRLILDAIRMLQDIDRGGTPWRTRVQTTTAFRYLAPVLETLLHEPGLAVAELKMIGAVLANLGRSEPPLRSHLRGEWLHDALRRCLVPLMKPGWTPPGGWGGSTTDLRPATGVTGPERNRLLRTCRRNGRRVDQLTVRCRRAGTGRACLDLAAGQQSDDPRPYFLRGAERAFYLAGARVHVAVRLLARRRGIWPESAGIVAALPDARRDPFTGRPLRVERRGRFFLVRPSGRLSGDHIYVIHRPAGKLR